MLNPETELNEQIAKLHKRFNGVRFDPTERSVLMPFRLDATFEDVWIVEDYSLRIVLPEGYPRGVPSVYETSGSIPEEFEHRFQDGALCVGVPSEILMRFGGQLDLLDFIEQPITQCLYSASYLKRYGRYPFGERSHGILGVLEFYEDYFGHLAIDRFAGLMKAVISGYRGSDPCPCGSGKQIWMCHGASLERLTSDACRLSVGQDLAALTDAYASHIKRERTKTAVRRTSHALWSTSN